MRIEPAGLGFVWRDDLRHGGTKAAILPQFLTAGRAYAYAGPCEGYAQLALAVAAQSVGAEAHLFCAARKTRHALTSAAAAYGATIHEVACGYLNVVQARARTWCGDNFIELLPFGLDAPCFEDALAAYARASGAAPSEVWCAAGSGLLARALGAAFPDVEIYAVQVGRDPDCGRAQVIKHPLPFAKNAKVLPPFPSASNYDAKVWEYFEAQAAPGALFWNVGA